MKNIVLHTSNLDDDKNLATDSDRVKPPMVGAGPTDFFFFFWGGKHDVANQAGAEGDNCLAPTASQKTSEKVELPNVDHAKRGIISRKKSGRRNAKSDKCLRCRHAEERKWEPTQASLLVE